MNAENPALWAAISLFITQLFGFLLAYLKNRSQDSKVVDLQRQLDSLEVAHRNCLEHTSEEWPSDPQLLVNAVSALKRATNMTFTFGEVVKICRQIRNKPDNQQV